jgi:hypothetical protein
MNELDIALNLLEPFTAMEWMFVGTCFFLGLWLVFNDEDYK